MCNSTHISEFRVYYEDTDAGGVVYYANYLKFAERARTEMLRDMDINQSTLAEEGVLFVVKSFAANLKAPARLDDMVTIKTQIHKIHGAKIEMIQDIYVDTQHISEFNVVVATISKDFKPVRLPEEVKVKFIEQMQL